MIWLSRGVFGLAAVVVLMASQVQAFSSSSTTRPPTTTRAFRSIRTVSSVAVSLPKTMKSNTWFSTTTLHAANNNNGDKKKSRRFLKRILGLVPKSILKKAKPISLAVLTLLSMDRIGVQPILPKPALASAPLAATPHMQEEDLEDEALKRRDKELLQQTQQELTAFRTRARQIEEKQGVEARKQFEKDYQEEQNRKALEKAEGLEQLKRDLLAQGICPRNDIEGERQVILYTKGIDLSEVEGCKFFAEKINERRFPESSWKVQKRAHRFILQCRVEDMMRRGVDPLEYYEELHRGATNKIFDIPPRKAYALERQYKENLAKYDQITVPVEGEKIAPRGQVMGNSPQDEKAAAALAKANAKAKAKEEKAAEKARNAEAKARAREEKAAEKAKAKEEKAKAKEEASAAKAAAKAAAAAAAGAAAATAGAAAKAVGDTAGVAVDMASPSTPGSQGSIVGSPVSEEGVETSEATSEAVDEKAVAETSKKTSSGTDIPIVPVATFVAAAGGGGYAFKVYRERAASAEEERQRQFKLIMGMDEDDDDSQIDGDTSGPSWTAPALEEVEPDTSSMKAESVDKDKSGDDASVAKAPEPTPEQPKKRKLGIKSMFSKKKNDRETHLNVVLAPSATAPEFASLLARILTFGAPGRFPQVVALPGGMPMENFDLDEAKEKLIESRTAAGITAEESAEVFANVMNCMLIDIVDLASSTLKEKDTKVTVNAINVVVDFMNHGASLYDAVAPDVVITPVTYGGNLGSRKLEDMFRAYAVSAEVDEGRLSLLQFVFNISDKKVEGIMMKNMQKQMMDMLKGMKDGDGEMTPEMEEMMKSMGGGLEGGMPGMDGMGEPSAEEAKQMLSQIKEMKESGLLPKEELEQVRKDFEKMFGSGMDEIMSKAKEEEGSLSDDEQEVMDLMKAILED